MLVVIIANLGRPAHRADSRNGMDLLAHMLSEWRVTALPVVLDLQLWIAPFCGVAHGPVPV